MNLLRNSLLQLIFLKYKFKEGYEDNRALEDARKNNAEHNQL